MGDAVINRGKWSGTDISNPHGNLKLYAISNWNVLMMLITTDPEG